MKKLELDEPTYDIGKLCFSYKALSFCADELLL